MIAPSQEKSLCFCTSAFGTNYNLMARLLAQDLEQFSPGSLFIVYTDKPSLFKENSNVRAVKHSCRGVLPYHERRFAIWEALSVSSSVMYLDADVRICAPVPLFNFVPGLAARSCGSLRKHLESQQRASPQFRHKKDVIEKMASRVEIDLESADLKFINEFLFVVTADEGREFKFLKTWGELAIYADTLGIHKHPTYAMALAAAKANFPIYHSEMEGLDFFDDRIEKVRIKKGQSKPETKQKYFEQQRKIELPEQNFFQQFFSVATRKLSHLYNRIRVQITALILPSALVEHPHRDR